MWFSISPSRVFLLTFPVKLVGFFRDFVTLLRRKIQYIIAGENRKGKEIIVMRDKLTVQILLTRVCVFFPPQKLLPSLHMCYTFNRLTNAKWLPQVNVTFFKWWKNYRKNMKCCFESRERFIFVNRNVFYPFFSHLQLKEETLNDVKMLCNMIWESLKNHKTSTTNLPHTTVCVQIRFVHFQFQQSFGGFMKCWFKFDGNMCAKV